MKKFKLVAVLTVLSLVLVGCGLPAAGDIVSIEGEMPKIVVNGEVRNPSGGDPGAVVPPDVAPPSGGVASIQIANHPVLEVPEMRGKFFPGDYPELWQDGGAAVVVFGDLFANADDQIWWKANEGDEWTILTQKVEDYTQISPGAGVMLVHDLGGDETHVTFLEQMPEDQLGARPQSMVTQPASVVAPAARSAVGGSMTIDGETLELPGMKGPFYREEGRFPSMWSDEGAEVLVQGTVWIQADDYVEWSPDGTNWNKITLNVSEYGQIPTGKIRVRIKNIAGPTYWKLVEFPPE